VNLLAIADIDEFSNICNKLLCRFSKLSLFISLWPASRQTRVNVNLGLEKLYSLYSKQIILSYYRVIIYYIHITLVGYIKIVFSRRNSLIHKISQSL
jgi:hypothetical protein